MEKGSTLEVIHNDTYEGVKTVRPNYHWKPLGKSIHISHRPGFLDKGQSLRRVEMSILGPHGEAEHLRQRSKVRRDSE